MQEGRGCRHATAGLRTSSRRFKLARDLFVGPDSGKRPVPRTAIPIAFRVADLGESFVYSLPAGSWSGSVDRRAHERMAELDPGPDVQ